MILISSRYDRSFYAKKEARILRNAGNRLHCGRVALGRPSERKRKARGQGEGKDGEHPQHSRRHQR